MGQITIISVTAETYDDDSDYQHRQLIEAINKVARNSHFDSVDYEYSCQREVDITTEAEVTVHTESDEKDRKHRKAVEDVQEAVNNSSFDRRVLRWTTEQTSDWSPDQVGEVSELDPEDHKIDPPEGK